VTAVDTNVYTGDKKEPRRAVVTAKERKLFELGINAAQLKATRHVDKLVKIGNFMKDKDTRLIWESTPQSGFQPSNGEQLKYIEQKIPTQEEVVDMVEYFRSEQGKQKWEDFKHYVEMSSPDWSNTMAYLMTRKGPGDYGDRLD